MNKERTEQNPNRGAAAPARREAGRDLDRLWQRLQRLNRAVRHLEVKLGIQNGTRALKG